jgi:hypothetical protein
MDLDIKRHPRVTCWISEINQYFNFLPRQVDSPAGSRPSPHMYTLASLHQQTLILNILQFIYFLFAMMNMILLPLTKKINLTYYSGGSVLRFPGMFPYINPL